MRILYADSVDPSGPDRLTAAGHDVTVEPGLSADELAAAVTGQDVLVVRSTRVGADVIEAGDRLGLIVRAGAGTDTIDTDAASARGVYVCNVPGRNAIAVAELTLGLLLAVDRRIPDNTADLRDGVWNKKRYSEADGLAGKCLAIIGLGDIGLAVAERARAFDLRVVAEDRPGRSPATLAAVAALGIELVPDRTSLLAEADIVSIHVPKAADTVALVDRAFLAALRPGAILLNTSRGEVVDGEALLEALDGGRIRAGLDVWPDEPGSGSGGFDSALARHPAVVGTHHIGASTDQAQRSVAQGTVDTIEAYLAGAPINCVNLRREPAGSSALTIRHLDRVGVLAKVLDLLRDGDINVQQMQNQVFRGGEAAVATIQVAPDPSDATLDAIAEIDEVFAVIRVPSTPA